MVHAGVSWWFGWYWFVGKCFLTVFICILPSTDNETVTYGSAFVLHRTLQWWLTPTENSDKWSKKPHVEMKLEDSTELAGIASMRLQFPWGRGYLLLIISLCLLYFPIIQISALLVIVFTPVILSVFIGAPADIYNHTSVKYPPLDAAFWSRRAPNKARALKGCTHARSFRFHSGIQRRWSLGFN